MATATAMIAVSTFARNSRIMDPSSVDLGAVLVNACLDDRASAWLLRYQPELLDAINQLQWHVNALMGGSLWNGWTHSARRDTPVIVEPQVHQRPQF